MAFQSFGEEKQAVMDYIIGYYSQVDHTAIDYVFTARVVNSSTDWYDKWDYLQPRI